MSYEFQNNWKNSNENVYNSTLQKREPQHQDPETFAENIRLYLKPRESKCNAYIHFFLVLLDTALTLYFYYLMVNHIFFGKFKNLNEKAIVALIGIGLSSFVLIYAILDGIRYLTSTLDKVLYFLSCILSKPILLPMIFMQRF